MYKEDHNSLNNLNNMNDYQKLKYEVNSKLKRNKVTKSKIILIIY